MYLANLVKLEKTPKGSPADIPSVAIVSAWAKDHCNILYTQPNQMTKKETDVRACGWTPSSDGTSWEWVENVEVKGIYNRFPYSQDSKNIEELAAFCEAHAIPFANHPALIRLANDKWKTQEIAQEASVPIPKGVLASHASWDHIATWEKAYLKPRYGAFGEGIYYLVYDEGEVEAEGPSFGQKTKLTKESWDHWLASIKAKEEYILQQAITSPHPNWGGLSIRTLLQLTPEGTWQNAPRVARVSKLDPVANVARGATAYSLEELCKDTWGQEAANRVTQHAKVLEKEIASALIATLPPSQQKMVVEIGIDLLLDPERNLWALEVNGFPQGRLNQLAIRYGDRFTKAFQEAHTLPFSRLISLIT